MFNRTALVSATICCSEESLGIKAYLELAFNFASTQHDLTVAIGLEILASLPQLIEDLDLSRQHRVALQQQLVQAQPAVFQEIIEILSRAPNSDWLVNVSVPVLRTLRTWACQNQSLSLSLSQFAKDYSYLFLFALNAFSGSSPLV